MPSFESLGPHAINLLLSHKLVPIGLELADRLVDGTHYSPASFAAHDALHGHNFLPLVDRMFGFAGRYQEIWSALKPEERYRFALAFFLLFHEADFHVPGLADALERGEFTSQDAIEGVVFFDESGNSRALRIIDDLARGFIRENDLRETLPEELQAQLDSHPDPIGLVRAFLEPGFQTLLQEVANHTAESIGFAVQREGSITNGGRAEKGRVEVIEIQLPNGEQHQVFVEGRRFVIRLPKGELNDPVLQRLVFDYLRGPAFAEIHARRGLIEVMQGDQVVYRLATDAEKDATRGEPADRNQVVPQEGDLPKQPDRDRPRSHSEAVPAGTSHIISRGGLAHVLLGPHQLAVGFVKRGADGRAEWGTLTTQGSETGGDTHLDKLFAAIADMPKGTPLNPVRGELFLAPGAGAEGLLNEVTEYAEEHGLVVRVLQQSGGTASRVRFDLGIGNEGKVYTRLRSERPPERRDLLTISRDELEQWRPTLENMEVPFGKEGSTTRVKTLLVDGVRVTAERVGYSMSIRFRVGQGPEAKWTEAERFRGSGTANYENLADYPELVAALDAALSSGERQPKQAIPKFRGTTQPRLDRLFAGDETGKRFERMEEDHPTMERWRDAKRGTVLMTPKIQVGETRTEARFLSDAVRFKLVEEALLRRAGTPIGSDGLWFMQPAGENETFDESGELGARFGRAVQNTPTRMLLARLANLPSKKLAGARERLEELQDAGTLPEAFLVSVMGRNGVPQDELVPFFQLIPRVLTLIRDKSVAEVRISTIDDRPDWSGAGSEESECFPAGTVVHTPGGDKRIESIRPGDRVFARGPPGSPVVPKPVLRTFVTLNRPLLKLTFRDREGRREDIRATYEHPFYLEARGWTPAEEIRLGDLVQTERGTVTAVALLSEPTPATVYNFEVADLHTYFVGSLRTWVHNNCDLDDVVAALKPFGLSQDAIAPFVPRIVRLSSDDLKPLVEQLLAVPEADKRPVVALAIIADFFDDRAGNLSKRRAKLPPHDDSVPPLARKAQEAAAEAWTSDRRNQRQLLNLAVEEGLDATKVDGNRRLVVIRGSPIARTRFEERAVSEID